MQWATFATQAIIVIEYLVKIIAVGVVPENRRPSSSQAWLLLILFVPIVGVPLFLLIGSPYVRGRRHAIQTEANKAISGATAETSLLPDLPAELNPPKGIASIIRMGRDLTGLPCVTGRNEGLFGNTPEAYASMTEAIAGARSYVHVEFYIMAWDEITDDLFTALAAAVQRGVKVRLLLDHLGSRRYPGWGRFRRRLTKAGIDWHLMMPIDLMRLRWRRPDLRNHRKLLVVDGDCAFVGSHNVIDPTYLKRRNRRMGREWKDLSIKLSGPVVTSVESVFATDWFSETGERLGVRAPEDSLPVEPGGPVNAFQIIPSGPGFPTEPNLRLFSALIHQATERITITSPYFVPDESLLGAITTACYRGVEVRLFVGEEADQFFVGHAQRSYYQALLEAGVRIYLYPKPTVLHAKYLIIDDMIGAIGSSNMDFRSFALDYEITMIGFGGDFVSSLRSSDSEYLEVSRELTLTEWRQQPWWSRYVDNVCRLTSALM